MFDNQVEVYSKTTGAKQMVPEHYLGNPVLGKDFEITPSGREARRLAAGPSDDWRLAELQAHMDARGISRTGLSSKAEHLEAIDAFTAEHAPVVPATQTPAADTGQGPTPVDTTGDDGQGDGDDGTPTTETPGAGDHT